MDAVETGCLIDGHMGWHAHYMAIDIAVNYGMPLDYADKRALAAYKSDDDTDGGYIVNQGGLLDKAEQWLNDNIAENGHSFGWHEGEFFYMPAEWWQEV